MKKIISCLLTAVMLITALNIPVFAQEEAVEQYPDACITVPSDVQLYVGQKGSKHFVSFTQQEPTAIEENDGTTAYYFSLKDGKTYNYCISSENYITYAGKFKFAADGEIVDVGESKISYIAPGYYINKPWFEYNEKDKLYYRFQYGDKQIDEVTGEQLAFTNVILQYSDWETHDTSKYLAFDCHTEGYALIFSNGTATEAHWVREGDQDDGVIRYYDIGLEHEIVLNQGKTMVCLIQDFINDKQNPNVEFH